MGQITKRKSSNDLIVFCSFQIFEDTSAFRGATDTPVLDFW